MNLTCTNSSSDISPTHFTGKQRDNETGLDYFGARYNASTIGRFMSPDPDNASAFLYPDDPQSWNGYPYARNNPLGITDPTGETYEYCTQDKEGHYTQCNTVSDKQHAAAVKEGVNQFTKDGKILDRGTQIGTYRQIDVDLPGDPEANRQAAGMIVQTFNSAMEEFGKNAAYAATGTLAVRGLGVAAEAVEELGIFKNTKVVINWAHKLTSYRPGHIPPPGSVAEITSAVEGVVKTGNYTLKAGGLIEGTTTIQGVKVGFSGRLVNGVARISTVFTDVR